MQFLEQLNESQRKAVEYTDGASLVIAGAGSGKTRVLTYKIAYLIKMGMHPWEIMALTFTNKAAKEMKERIVALAGDDARYLQMGTFHSVFAKILRREAKRIGYDSNFTIYDESDSRSLCKIIVKQLQLDDKIYKPADVHSRISDAKNRLISPEDYAIDAGIMERDKYCNVPQMPVIYKLYVEGCRKSNAMDFDDLLYYTYLLLAQNNDIRKQYSDRYRFLLVDEYQDTNYVQQQIVWMLTKDHQHICVVGDDAQSIYGFRGANIDNILDFQQLYTDSKLFKLERNYRSTQRIVAAANSLIRHNNRQIPKEVYSKNAEGDKLTLRMLASDKEEAVSVSQSIRMTVKRGEATWKDFAILYRTNYQSRAFEEQLLKSNVPYRVYGGTSFYQRKEIKDVLAYFRLVVNHHDEEAFRRVINYPTRGIGDTSVSRIIAAAQETGESMWSVCANLASYNVNVSKAVCNKIAAFQDMISRYSSHLDDEDAFVLGSELIKESGVSADVYGGHEPEDISRQENLEEFLDSMQDFVESNREEGLSTGLVEYLQDVSLMSDKDSDDDDNDNKVTLMTIHSSKGLEFPYVFVVGMEENIFPSPMCTDSMRLLEEERRLLYVAITRAEKHCVLTCAKSRFRYGHMEFDAPSRFLKDIDSRLMTVESSNYISDFSYGNTRQNSGYERSYSQVQTSKPVRKVESVASSKIMSSYKSVGMSSASAMPASSSSVTTAGGLSVGDRVEHSRFGIGLIHSIEGSGDNAKATVEFRNIGTKQLLLKFAKLRKL